MNSICIVGAGKIAYSLTNALLEAKYNVCSIFSRKKESSEELAARFNLSCHTDNLSEIPSNAVLFFLAVPDSEIENAANDLSNADLHFENSIFVHLSGSVDIGPLKSLMNRGASIASFHIMQTFPSFEIVDIKDHYAAIETNDPETEQFLFSLARRLLLKPFSISSGNKVFYHLTGVFASNFLVANLYNASLAFNKSKISDASFLDIVGPIIESTLTNIRKEGISNALSGPVARGDIETIKKHLNALETDAKVQQGSSNFPSSAKPLLLSYLGNSLALLELLKESKGQLSEKQEDIKSFLESTFKSIN